MNAISVAGSGSGTKTASLSLKALLSLGSGLLLAALVLLLSFVIESAATHKIERQIGSELQELAFQMHDKLRRGLSERLHDIQLAANLSAFADETAPVRTQQALLHWLRHIYPEYTWIGLADPAGHPIAAANSTPRTIDFSRSDWFEGGLSGPYVGAMQPTSVLQLIGNAEARAFVDLAAPVIRNGDVVGVLGASLGWDWAEDAERALLAPLRRRRETKLFVLNTDGVVVLGPSAFVGKTLAVNSAATAKQGGTGYSVAIWPDGITYVTGFTAGANDPRNNEWRGLVLVRQEASIALSPIADMHRYLLLCGGITALSFTLLAWFGAKWISAPLKTLAGAADRLECGTGARMLPIFARYTEVALLSNSLAALLTRLHQNELRFRNLALGDPLTGLPNRALFRDRLQQAVAHRRRTKYPVALLLVDLDRFKDINDTLGHPAGDQLLRQAGRRLATCLRETDTVARLGGDEFALILSKLQNKADATVVARKAVAELTKPFHLDGHDAYISASVGVAICDDDTIDCDGLLRQADLALYHTKASGGCACGSFEPSMAADVEARKKLERELRRAFEGKKLELHFQPELDLRSGHLRGVEALLRWRQHGRGWVNPAEVVAVAESTGQIIGIGSWALREACRQAKIWRQAGLAALTVAVNVSLIQCRQGDFAATVEAALREAELPPQALELEVTESVFMRKDEETVLAQLTALRQMGVGVALDDFGTGYSSLDRLRALPVDKVKIDRSFVARLGHERGADTIVRAMVALGHGLGLHVTAEGVENESQFRFLHSAGCDSVQGFLVGRPAHAKYLTKAPHTTENCKQVAARSTPSPVATAGASTTAPPGGSSPMARRSTPPATAPTRSRPPTAT